MNQLHRYLGISLSFIVLLISLTGVMLVWKKEFLWVSIAASRELPAEFDVLAQATKNIKASYKPNEVLFARFYAEGLSIHKVFLRDGRFAWHDQFGKHIQTWRGDERFEDWLLGFHKSLLLGGKFVTNIVGIVGLLMVLLMCLGGLLWWPARKIYGANIMPKSTKHQHFVQSHAETGITIALPALLVVITGIVLVFPMQSKTIFEKEWFVSAPLVNELVNDEFGLHKKQRQKNGVGLGNSSVVDSEERSNTQIDTATVDYSSAFQSALAKFPEGAVRWLSFPGDYNSGVTIGIKPASSWNDMGYSSVELRGSTVVSVKRESNQRLGTTLLNYAYPIHTGKFSIFYRLMLSATGMLIAWMCFMGMLAFVKRPK